MSLRLLKDVIRLYGSCTAAPITKDMLTSVRKAHSEYVLEVDRKKMEKQVNEDATKKRLQESEELKALQKKEQDTLVQLHEQEEHEKEQSQEQYTARHLIAEASMKLASALQDKGSNSLKAARVPQIMLDAGNQKLQSSCTKLDEIKLKKQKLEEKLKKNNEKQQIMVNSDSSTHCGSTLSKRKKNYCLSHCIVYGYTGYKMCKN